MRGNDCTFGSAGGDKEPAAETPPGASSPTQHIPFEQDAANLFFQVISRRYEKGSTLLTSNKVFG